jgi:hypothetical protein
MYPHMTAGLPVSDNVDHRRAYEYVAESIADHLGYRGLRPLLVEVQHGARGLSARVTAEPKLAKRERRKVRDICMKVGRKFFSLNSVPAAAVTTRAAVHPAAASHEPQVVELPAFLNDEDSEEDLGPPLAPPQPDFIRVFDITAINSMIQSIGSAPLERESTQRLTSMLQRIRSLGPYRRRAQPAFAWRIELERLGQEFPNFADVVEDVVRPHLALLSRGAFRARLPPVLLLGPPGVGKTAFARHLAGLLGSAFIASDFATATNNGDLAGSSSYWQNWQPGQVLKALGWGLPGQAAVADPVVLIDEVDKVTSDRYDPRGALYSLLEADTARRFEDACLPGISFDASLVRWILTCNDLRAIPQPILSRTRVFDIRPLTPQETLALAQRKLIALVEALGIEFDTKLPRQLHQAVMQLTPRELGLALEGAIGNAVAADRFALDPSDWVRPAPETRRARIGFV